MTVDDENDVEKLKEIGQIVADILQYMGNVMEPGMTARELDHLGAAKLEVAGARSAPISMYSFPGATCISINGCVAHGIPDDTVIQAGDMVNIDVSAERGGYFADTGATFLVPPSKAAQKSVCHATQLARNAAVKALTHGAPLNAVGRSVETVAKKFRLKIIKNLAGHGIGRSLHEEPGHIYSYFDRKDTRLAHKGMVLAIEPFLSTRSDQVSEGDDGWSLYLDKGGYAAQYEHTIIVTDREPIILTLPSAP